MRETPVPIAASLQKQGKSMPSRLRPLGLGLIVIVVIAITVGLSRPLATRSEAADELHAAGPLKWYRGNLHTHSLWSDGDDYPEMITLWYIEHNYDFLAFTDHNLLADKERWVDVDQQRAYLKLKERFPDGWIEERTRDEKRQVRLKRFEEIFARFNQKDKFLLIQGEEISDSFGKSPIHLNANHLKEVIRPQGGTNVTDVIQNNVDALVAHASALDNR